MIVIIFRSLRCDSIDYDYLVDSRCFCSIWFSVYLWYFSIASSRCCSCAWIIVVTKSNRLWSPSSLSDNWSSSLEKISCACLYSSEDFWWTSWLNCSLSTFIWSPRPPRTDCWIEEKLFCRRAAEYGDGLMLGEILAAGAGRGWFWGEMLMYGLVMVVSSSFPKTS